MYAENSSVQIIVRWCREVVLPAVKAELGRRFKRTKIDPLAVEFVTLAAIFWLAEARHINGQRMLDLIRRQRRCTNICLGLKPPTHAAWEIGNLTWKWNRARMSKSNAGHPLVVDAAFVGSWVRDLYRQAEIQAVMEGYTIVDELPVQLAAVAVLCLLARPVGDEIVKWIVAERERSLDQHGETLTKLSPPPTLDMDPADKTAEEIKLLRACVIARGEGIAIEAAWQAVSPEFTPA
jgi:hypothetical protein